MIRSSEEIIVNKNMGDVPRKVRIDRTEGKIWWRNVYRNWEDEQLKEKFRINRDTFEYVLNIIKPFIEKTPTNLVPNPIEADRQLALTIYRLAHGCDFAVISDLFGVSKSLAIKTLNHVVRELVVHMYKDYVKMPQDESEWISELKGFIENYEFPCIGAWDGFHVYIRSKLKIFYNFKHRYSVSNMGLVGYNKRFLDLTVGAPGSTHDARFLRNTGLFKRITAGEGLPNKGVHLGDEYGEIPLVTIGDSAFPRFSWLVKGFSENTNDPKERKFNLKLKGARAVTENAYGMLKGRWRILYKKTEMKTYNLKYIIMSCVMLHNLCISRNDPCNHRWRLTVAELELHDKIISRQQNKGESNENANKIADWLWEQIP